MHLRPGETEAVGWRVANLLDVVQHLKDASPHVSGRARVIGIDGRGGAGKTTLARRLSAVVTESAIVHTDDIAWHHAYFDWGNVLVENVLRPLHQGEAVNYRPQPWITHGRPGAITVPAGIELVMIEGTGIIREELASWLDASIWMQGDIDEQERLLVARDGDSAEQMKHVTSWLQEEVPFLLREQPWARATMIIAGPAHLDHNPETELVVAPPSPPSASEPA